jgi:hypothetical protein
MLDVIWTENRAYVYGMLTFVYCTMKLVLPSLHKRSCCYKAITAYSALQSPLLLVTGIADMQTASNTLCIVALRDHTSYTTYSVAVASRLTSSDFSQLVNAAYCKVWTLV